MSAARSAITFYLAEGHRVGARVDEASTVPTLVRGGPGRDRGG
ncbi:hypothetical protein [Streptomyces sp. NBC_00076]